jgi:hypothetical protein
LPHVLKLSAWTAGMLRKKTKVDAAEAEEEDHSKKK